VGRWDDAERVLPRALALGREAVADAPKTERYRVDLAVSLEEYAHVLWLRGRRSEAETECRKAIDLLKRLVGEQTEASYYLFHLARCQEALCGYLEAMNRPDGEAVEIRNDALRSLRNLIVAYPDTVDYRRLLATIALAKARGRRSPAVRLEAILLARDALAHYESLVSDFPESRMYRDTLVNLHAGIGQLLGGSRPADAVAEFKSALKIQPANAGLLDSLAWILATCPDERCRDASQAVELARRAVAVEAKVSNFWNTLGVAEYRAGDYAAARRSLERSMQLGSGGGPADWAFMAMLLWKTGKPDEARSYHRRATQWITANHPDDRAELERFVSEAESLFAQLNGR
jgi:tetratricopeptide (TPR) repeat protein